MAMISPSASTVRLLHEHSVSTRRNVTTMTIAWRHHQYSPPRTDTAYSHPDRCHTMCTRTCIGMRRLPAVQQVRVFLIACNDVVVVLRSFKISDQVALVRVQGLAHPRFSRNVVDSRRARIPGLATGSLHTDSQPSMGLADKASLPQSPRTITLTRQMLRSTSIPSCRSPGCNSLASPSTRPHMQRQDSRLRPCPRRSLASHASSAGSSTASWERQGVPVVKLTTAVLVLLPLTLALTLAGYHLLVRDYA